MKNNLFSLIALAFIVLVSCQSPTAVEEAAKPDYAAFDANVEIMRSFIKAHCEENLDTQVALISDTLKWSPPHYNGNEWLGKEEYVAALKAYHDNFENISYTEGIVMKDSVQKGFWSGSVFPEEDATSTPTALRMYGTWKATHTESGKEIGVKWFGLGFINEEGKIVAFTEYWDVNGLAAQIAAE